MAMYSNRLDYAAVYSNAKAELEELQKGKALAERALAEINEYIEVVSATMRAIEPVIGKEPFRDFLREARGPSPEEPDLGEKLVELAKEFGVTHGIRTLLGSSSTGLSAPEIKTALQSGGWNADEYKNPLAFVHTVLKRLVEAGEVAELPAVEGTKRYRWAVGKPEATTAPGNGTGRVRREKKIGVVHRRP